MFLNKGNHLNNYEYCIFIKKVFIRPLLCAWHREMPLRVGSCGGRFQTVQKNTVTYICAHRQ